MGKSWEWRWARCLVVPIHAANLFFVRFLRIYLSASLYIGPNNVRIGPDPPRAKQWNACISWSPVCRRTGFLPCTSIPSHLPPHIWRTFPPSKLLYPSSTSRNRTETHASRFHHSFVRLPSSSRPSTCASLLLVTRVSTRNPNHGFATGADDMGPMSRVDGIWRRTRRFRARAHVLRSSFRPRVASVLRRRR